MRKAMQPNEAYAQRDSSYPYYGYDIYLSSLAANVLRLESRTTEHSDAVGVLMDAAWWFVGRGILRPGVKRAGAQHTNIGASEGFSLTLLGKDWLNREAPLEVPVTSPSKMKSLFLEFNKNFSPAFTQRANEAVACYDVKQYLSSCVMSGAAAESILLGVAIAKTRDEKNVMNTYAGRDGRRGVERMILGQAKQHLKDNFSHYMELLKYWRDQAAHGAATPISEEEAYLALVALVRFARFVRQNWSELTS